MRRSSSLEQAKRLTDLELFDADEFAREVLEE